MLPAPCPTCRVRLAEGVQVCLQGKSVPFGRTQPCKIQSASLARPADLKRARTGARKAQQVSWTVIVMASEGQGCHDKGKAIVSQEWPVLRAGKNGDFVH